MPDPWTAIEFAARYALPRLKELVLGTPDERGAAKAVAKATWAAAAKALPSGTPDDVEHLAAALLQYLDSSLLDDLVVEEGGSASQRLLTFLEDAFAPLSISIDLSHGRSALDEMGVLADHSDIAHMMLDRLTDNLLLWTGEDAHQLRDLALLLKIERVETRSALVDSESRVIPIRMGEANQARMVVGWVSLSVDPPQLQVKNQSDGPIFDVQPTPFLWAQDQQGRPSAMVGGGPLSIRWSNRPRRRIHMATGPCDGMGPRSNSAVATTCRVHGRSWPQMAARTRPPESGDIIFEASSSS